MAMKEAVQHLLNLVKIPSVSSMSNRPVIDYAMEVLHEAQWQTRELKYLDSAGIEKANLIAAPAGDDFDAAAELAFVCHTDTVPYSSAWKEATDPLVEDGLLHGCGACDVKGFLACLLTAIEQTHFSKLVRGLRVVLTADEEVGCIGAGKLLESGLVRARRMVVGEPTSLRPARAGKGYCLAEVTVFGQEAHSALPHKGKSAIYRAARAIKAIEDLSLALAGEQNELFSPGFTTLNIGTIHGGTAKNIIPGQCSFQLEWRPIPAQSLATKVGDEVREIFEKMQSFDQDLRWELKMVRQQSGFETPAQSLLVRSLKSLTGRQPTSIPFASEASLFGGIAEEVVVFGPGDMQTAHSSRECVPLTELDEAVGICKSLVTSYASG
jgi:acetylornithine deacetylase